MSLITVLDIRDTVDINHQNALNYSDDLFLSTLQLTESNQMALTEEHFKSNIILKCSSSNEISILIPKDLNVNQPLILVRYGSGEVVITSDDEVTLLNPNGITYNRLRAQYSVVSILPTDTNEYLLNGDLGISD